MPAAIFEDEDSPPVDPDDLKMPESPQHRQTSDLIGLVAANLLGDSHEVFRDMNWYPPDGGTAMAPDVMVLPAGAWVAPPSHGPDEQLKSYRQDLTGGPAPVVAVEVPSTTDSFDSLLGKADRCRRLGTTVFVVSYRLHAVFRWGLEDWTNQPIPELGGLRIRFTDDDLLVILPDGTTATSDVELLTQTQQRATAAEAQVAQAEAQAAQAEAQVAALARKLRELGVDPDAAAD